MSLPRLELLAAVVNARLLKFVVKTLPIAMKADRVVCWSDSMVVLCRIKGQSSSWKPLLQIVWLSYSQRGILSAEVLCK